VLTHEGKWITGTVTAGHGLTPAGTLGLYADVRIERGTSGGLVVDEAGRLLGLVSHCPDHTVDGGSFSLVPMPWLALPRWLVDRVAVEES
jgi:hypothetical protein